MRSSVILLLLLLCSGTYVQAHSLEPAYRAIRFQQGFTRFPMEAINAFDYIERYEVEVWADDTFSDQLEFRAIPDIFQLGPYEQRQIEIEMDEIPYREFLVCTRTFVDNGSTRVCSRVIVCRPQYSNSECKRQLEFRRNKHGQWR